MCIRDRDNTDLIQIKDGLDIIKTKLVNVIAEMSKFAMEYKDLPTLGFTHFQACLLYTSMGSTESR